MYEDGVIGAAARELADKLMELIEKGADRQWVKEWDAVLVHPYNPISNVTYSGMNFMNLMSEMALRGYKDPRWVTFRQCSRAGGHVKKGARGVRCVHWTEKKPRDSAGSPTAGKKFFGIFLRACFWKSEKSERRLIPCSFTVFNVEQTTGLDLGEVRMPPPIWATVERAESILAGSGAVIENTYGDTAFYDPKTDRITLPRREQFKEAAAFYGTAFHELSHWTGAKSRMDRDLTVSFGTDGYAREELRAEISSLMLEMKAGIPSSMGRHIPYISAWAKVLLNRPVEIYRACVEAQEICDYLMALEAGSQKRRAAKVLGRAAQMEFYFGDPELDFAC